jgi:hypothetical protein
MKFFRSPYLSLWLTVLVSLAGLTLWALCAPETVFRYTSEAGPIESLTEWAYLGAIGIMLLWGSSILKRKTLVALLIVLSYMAAREADLHKALFSISILKIKFWLSGSFSLTDKLIAAAILLPVVWALLYLLAFHTVSVFAGMRNRMPFSISIFMTFAVTATSKMLDRSLNALIEMFGWQFPQWLWALQASQEELLECLIPVLFIVALFQYRGYIRQRGMAFFTNY